MIKIGLDNIKLSSEQQEIWNILQEKAHQLNAKSLEQKAWGGNYNNIWHRLFGAKNSQPLNGGGVYLYGSVGAGKTMLAKEFFGLIQMPKMMLHYQKFMQDLHIKMHQMNHGDGHNGIYGREQILANLAQDISDAAKFLYIDELEIKDITDAMLIMSLFRELGKNGVFICMTSNAKPEDLYKDGIQRESFLPFIRSIRQNFDVLPLILDHDYRYNAAAKSEKRFLYPIDSHSNDFIDYLVSSLAPAEQWQGFNLQVFGRNLFFAQALPDVLYSNFHELFEREIGYNDYIEIAEYFCVIIVRGVRIIEPNETDIATRFINFIDNAYYKKSLLIMQMEAEPERIYSSGPKIKEFARTASRIREMDSSHYEARIL